MDVIHTAIWVSDLEEARAFFIDALGLEERWSFTFNGVENVYIGGDHADVQLKYSDDAPDPNPDRTALDHIAISVEDTDALAERIEAETPYTVVEGPMTIEVADARVAFIEGPDGYVVEFVES